MIATKRRIETEQDRVGGFSTTSYDRDFLSSTTFAPSVVEPVGEAPEEVFEVEREYKMDDLDSSQRLETPKSYMQSIQRRETNVDVKSKNAHGRMKLNMHGKIILAVFSCVLVLLTSFSIYNAVVIGKLNSEIALKEETLINSQTEVENLEYSVDNLSSESTIKSKLNTNFRKLKDTDKVYLEDSAKTEIVTYEKSTNFFDKLCEFFSNLF